MFVFMQDMKIYSLGFSLIQEIFEWTWNQIIANNVQVCLLNMYVKILVPGRIRFFNISVPVAEAFIKQILAPSRASCPWSPHNLNTQKSHIPNKSVFQSSFPKSKPNLSPWPITKNTDNPMYIFVPIKLKQLHVASAWSVGKHVQVNHVWFWFFFCWLRKWYVF